MAAAKGKQPPHSPTAHLSSARGTLPEGTRTVAATGYRVAVGAGLLAACGAHVREATRGASRGLIVHDDNLPRTLVESVIASLESAGIAAGLCPVRATEEDKSLATLETIYSAAVAFKLERDECLIALGGGVVGDVAGFAAATYRRGVPLVQMPTTLLAMVDASVGGKTAVNIRQADCGSSGPLKKNMVGAFHMPALVLCDVRSLQSLSDRELRSGLAECIKHGLIGADFGDPTLLAFAKQHMAALAARDEAKLVAFIARNVAVKADCVAKDPHERGSDQPHGGRMALNCGHTVAHAIETLPGLSHGADMSGLTHGEAVGLGLIAECALSAAMGLNAPDAVEELRSLLNSAGLPDRVRGLPPAEAIADAMLDDKKVAGGKLRMALPAADRRARLVVNPSRELLLGAIETIRER